MDNHLELIKVEIRYLRARAKITFRSWYNSDEPRTFEIPIFELENICAWIHEFCEETIWFLLRDKYNFHKEQLNKRLNIKLYNGKTLEQLPCHLIIALHTNSIYDDNIINSCEYARMIFRKQFRERKS